MESGVARALSVPCRDFLDTGFCRMAPCVGMSADAARKVLAKCVRHEAAVQFLESRGSVWRRFY